MRRLVRVILAVSLPLAAAPAVHAEKRIALLIGNQSYGSEIGRLANPHNDVALLERTLRALRFEVTPVRDAGLAALHQAVNAHVRRVRAAGPDTVAFFYYAGHGAADAASAAGDQRRLACQILQHSSFLSHAVPRDRPGRNPQATIARRQNSQISSASRGRR